MQHFCEEADRRGLSVAAEVMLRLLHDIYALPIPEIFIVRAGNWRRRILTGLSRRLLHDAAESGLDRMIGVKLALSPILISDRPRYIIRELGSLLVDRTIFVAAGASRSALILSIIGRPFFWTIRATLRRFRKC